MTTRYAYPAAVKLTPDGHKLVSTYLVDEKLEKKIVGGEIIADSYAIFDSGWVELTFDTDPGSRSIVVPPHQFLALLDVKNPPSPWATGPTLRLSDQ